MAERSLIGATADSELSSPVSAALASPEANMRGWIESPLMMSRSLPSPRSPDC